MTKACDILKFFEGFAPVGTAMDFDNCGLLAGEGEAEVKRALIALDITSEVISYAHEKGFDHIISHHPVIFTPLRSLKTDEPPYLLAKYGIGAICMHTNLDRAEDDGVNMCLARAVGLENIELDSENCLAVGDIEPTNAAALAKRVKEALGCEGVRYTEVKREIRRVAVSSGAGGGNIFKLGSAADALITGEIKHHELLYAASKGIAVIDAGHRKTEEVVLPVLLKKLSAAFPEVYFEQSRDKNDCLKFVM